MFHFLTDDKDRELYLEKLRRSLKVGGHFIIATFAEDGPQKCSGLEVVRYGLDNLRDTLGDNFELLDSAREVHQTPFNTTQNFLYAHFRKLGA